VTLDWPDPLRGEGPEIGKAGILSGGLDHRDVARILAVAQAELDRIDADRAATSSMKASLAKCTCGPTGSSRCAQRAAARSDRAGAGLATNDNRLGGES